MCYIKIVESSNIIYSDIDLLKFVLKVMYEHDCDDLAWRLIDRFGSVPNIFRAPYTTLIREKGMTKRVASFFSVARPIERQALLRSAQKVKLFNEFDLLQYIAVYGMNETEPFDMCIYLNNRNIIIGAIKLTENNKFKQAVYAACNFNAARTIVARYVPYNDLEPFTPSLVRLRTLINLIDLLENIGISVIDYFTYIPDKFYSLRRNLNGETEPIHISNAERDPYNNIKSILKPLVKYYNETTDSNITFPILES